MEDTVFVVIEEVDYERGVRVYAAKPEAEADVQAAVREYAKTGKVSTTEWERGGDMWTADGGDISLEIVEAEVNRTFQPIVG